MKPIRIGVFGCNIRGQYLVRDFMRLGCEVAAVCDNRAATKATMLDIVGKDCPWYDNFDAFIEHDMDAVVLCNFFHEHAPYAVRCLEKGIHVFSECISNGTMAEGVELIRAAEKSDATYMLAENYPQMIFNREMQRICRGGSLGKLLYAEGEYNHPGNPYDGSFARDYMYFIDHWRFHLPATYYITHSLGPVMRATGATPTKVTAFAAGAPIPDDVPSVSRVTDKTAVITTHNNDGSIFRITGCAGYGAHHNAYRICGTKGQVENLRGMGNQIMLRYNEWDKPENTPEVSLYEPKWNVDIDESLMEKSGHGGGDLLTVKMFVDAVKAGKQPEHPFDVHSAVAMSSVAILAHRSVLNGGQVYDIPDFHLEECRKQYENDRLSPFPQRDGTPPSLPCCLEMHEPTEEQIKRYLELIK